VNWTNNTNINQTSQLGPSLAVFNNKLYVAFIANNPGNAVLVCSSADGVKWTNNTDINQTSKFAPSLAPFNNKLYIAFIANNPGNAVLVCSSADGVNWTNNTDINQTSKFAPSLAAFKNRLDVAFIANNPGNAVLVCSSADGVNWTNNTDINQTSQLAPSLAATPFSLVPFSLVSTFSGSVTLKTANSTAPGPFTFPITFAVAFSGFEGAASLAVTVSSLPALSTGPISTPLGTDVVTVTMKNPPATGTLMTKSGAMGIRISLHFHHSLMIPFDDLDSDLTLVMSTGTETSPGGRFTDTGSPLGAAGPGAIKLVGDGAFQGGFFNANDASLVISGTVAPVPNP
jgi:hypothetical protein